MFLGLDEGSVFRMLSKARLGGWLVGVCGDGPLRVVVYVGVVISEGCSRIW